jgi:hypothetical protein
MVVEDRKGAKENPTLASSKGEVNIMAERIRNPREESRRGKVEVKDNTFFRRFFLILFFN